MNFNNNTEAALNFLKSTFTSNEVPQLSESNKIELSIPKNSFRNWMREQEKTYLCKFINRTSSSDERKKRNEEYMNNVSTDVGHESKRFKASDRKAKLLFSEVYYTYGLIIIYNKQ